ncbi:DMT family transporter [Effusibacillus lacus]|uniref:EamA family transporter n=1 Tax=Effusibacillus lacus TaxID=1348429 RepID=A0A292YJ41_9BACL|nr:DMT family transporter [Effusibacillus lacus]TCS70043.1 drug/metabolite transporter (DMT)-like permease [Effusibacillus lacus]GAX91117.1 EamA family transporter [Effusibacillus lacus]
MVRKSLIADLILLLVTFSWGATFVLVKEAIATMPPFTFLGVRFTIAAVLICLILLIFKRDQLHTDKGLIKAGLVLGFWLFAGYAFQTFGLQFTSVSKAGFITGLSVVLVPLFSVWLLHLKPKRPTVIGVLAATIGLALLSLDKVEAANLGDLLVFLCAVSYAMHIITMGKYAPRHKALPLAMYQIAAVAVLNFIGAFFFEPWQQSFTKDVLFNPTVEMALLICAVFATALAFVAQSQFQKFTTPTRTALIFSTEPVFAAVTAYLWADERLSGQAVVGCLLILAGMLFAELGGSDKEETTAEATASR